MKNLIYLIFILLTVFTLNGCFADATINSSGTVGMSVGGTIF